MGGVSVKAREDSIGSWVGLGLAKGGEARLPSLLHPGTTVANLPTTSVSLQSRSRRAGSWPLSTRLASSRGAARGASTMLERSQHSASSLSAADHQRAAAIAAPGSAGNIAAVMAGGAVATSGFSRPDIADVRTGYPREKSERPP